MYTQNERLIAALIYVTTLFGFFIIPLIIWLIKKDDSDFIDFHGRNSLNFSISVFLYGIAAGVLCIILIGFVLLGLLSLFALVFGVIGAIKAYDGVKYETPFVIRFFKTN